MLDHERPRLAARLIATASVVATCAAVSPALAQAPGSGELAANQVEAIVVTAERRAQRLDDVPAAVSAIGADQIEVRRVENLDDLSEIAPNVNFVSTSPDQGYVIIRGSFASAADGPGVDQGVSVYIDDVYANGPGDLPQDFFDLERIEVLRGPQGTLFGRNVTGGLIALHTKAPSFTPGFGADVTAGKFDLWQGGAYVTGPLIDDTLAARLTVTGLQRDGYHNSTINGRPVGDQNNWSARGQLLLKTGPAFSARLSYEHVDIRSDGPALSLLGDAPFFGDSPRLRSQASYDADDTNQAEPGTFKRSADNLSLRLDWELDFATLTSVTGYRHSSLRLNSVSLGDPGTTLGGTLPTPLPVYTFLGIQDDELLTQELRLTSPSDRRLTWIAGLYYIDSTRQRTESLPTGIVPLLVASGAQSQTVDLKGWAAFLDATWRITDTLSLTGGIRYTDEKKEGSTSKDGLFSGTGSFQINPRYSGSWHAVTPRLVLSYRPVAHALVYGSVSRGFKGGGFDFGGDLAASFDDPYAPEHVWNYELGARTSWLDRRLTLNAVLYRQDYTDLQVRLGRIVNGAVTVATSNAGKAYSEGLELEFGARPTQAVTLGASMTFQKSQLSKFAAAGALVNDVRSPLSPRYSLTFFGGLDLPVPEQVGALRLDASVSYRGKMFVRATDAFTGETNGAGEPDFIHDGTKVKGQANLSLTWTSLSRALEVQVWGKNITNERAISAGFEWTPLAQAFYGYSGSELYYVLYNDPRTYGVTLRTRF